MKSFFPTLYLALAALCLFPAALAHAQSGILLKTFDIKAGKLLLDPNRPRLYATLPQDNSLAVIDTDTNTVLTTFFIGATPASLAISPDGARLYVANSGSTSAGVGVVDLTNLTVLPSLPAPFPPVEIAAGLGNRLYLVPDGSLFNSIAQIDATTGTFQRFFNENRVLGGFLRLEGDRKTLVYGDGGGLSEGTLYSFDVSTATPAALATVDGSSSYVQTMSLSHNGQFLVYHGDGGNGTGGDGSDHYVTALFSVNNLPAVLGNFASGAFPGVGGFSSDDSLFYQAQVSTEAIQIFSTSTFTLLDRFHDPNPGPDSTGYEATVTDLAATPAHGYLYIAERGTTGATINLAGPLELVSTQRAAFFDGSVALTDGFYYLKLPGGVPFGYYNFNFTPYLYHSDLGFEYPFDAADGQGGVYLYDFKSKTFWYTSSSLFPYLYDFTLNTFLYYYPDPSRPDHYNTNGVRYFYDFATGKIISK